MSFESDEAIKAIDRIVQQSERGLFGAGAARDKVKQVLEAHQDDMQSDSYRVRCDRVHEMWGPHPGCAEFMEEPEAIVRCNDEAEHFMVVKNHGPEGASVEAQNLCRDHWVEMMTPWQKGESVPYEELVCFGRLK